MSGTTWKTRAVPATRPAPALLPLQQPHARALARHPQTSAPARDRATTWPALAGRGLFGVVTCAQTWRNALYLTLALPLGLAYVTLLFGGLALGGALLLLILGLPVLLALLEGGLRVATFERRLARRLLGAELGEGPRVPQGAPAQQFAAQLSDPANWKTVGYLFVKLPLGFVTGSALLVLAAVTGGLLLAPALYSSAPLVIDGVWHVDSLPEALASMLLGLPALLLTLHTLNALAVMSGGVARALLGERAG